MKLFSSLVNIVDRLGLQPDPREKRAMARMQRYLHAVPVTPPPPAVRVIEVPATALLRTRVAFEAETVSQITPRELRAIQTTAANALKLIAQYSDTPASPEWTLEQLDSAVEGWARRSPRFRMPKQEVIDVVGSAFGEYCNRQLGMVWIKVKHAGGVAFGIRGRERDYRGFPYSTVSQRIKANQYGFLRSMFQELENSAGR